MGTVVGLLAHVDAGKTTLAEQLLYRAGALRTPGRVDAGTAALDFAGVERERGITVFSAQAAFQREGRRFFLLDTPGHTDFSGEMERALSVLDCAVLVVSAVEGVRGHTRALWRLLRERKIPTLLFLNKTDQEGADPEGVLSSLPESLGGEFLSWSAPLSPALAEALAGLDEALLERWCEGNYDEALWQETGGRLFREGAFFPVFSGCALDGRGVDDLLSALTALTAPARAGGETSLRVYQIRRDKSLGRVSYVKVLSGTLRPRQTLSGEEKIDRVLLAQGGRFQPLEEAGPGDLCAVTGLKALPAGTDWPAGEGTLSYALRPALSAKVEGPPDLPPAVLRGALKELEEEEPLLSSVWEEQLGQLRVRVMGKVQLEVLSRVLEERWGIKVSFGRRQVLYRETIAGSAVGCGHFEPLRHYAEVHLRLSPGARGSGVRFESECPTDQLEAHWQNLIATHVLEREFRGVLTGSPLTDVTVTLLAGRAHLKHTEGGDFREAVGRAMRQGLMEAESILLEPWYAFVIEVPQSLCGRVLADVQAMGGEYESPESIGDRAVLRGRCSVEAILDYPAALAAFSKGEGSIVFSPGGYEPCPRQAQVVAELGYDPERDVEFPSSSVFCTHGAGRTIPWQEAKAHMYIQI